MFVKNKFITKAKLPNYNYFYIKLVYRFYGLLFIISYQL